MIRRLEARLLPSEKTLMPGDGILKTTTDIITAHTASAVHGIGADITARTGAHIIARGYITDTTTHGITVDITIHGITADTGEVTMTRGIMEDTMEVCTPDTGAGMTHGTITITIAVGTTIIALPAHHTSAGAPAATKTHITAFVHAPNPMEHSPRATVLRASHQVQSEQPAALSEVA